MFEVEFAKDTPDGRFRKGQRVTAYALHWALAFERTPLKVQPYVDKFMLLIWSEFYGWAAVEACYLVPAGAPVPNLGICGEAETK